MRFATIAQKPITFSLLSQISFVDSLSEFSKVSTSDSLAPLVACNLKALSFEMNNLRSNNTEPEQAMRNEKIALVTVNREDSLTQLVKAHAMKTKPAVTHSYVRLNKFKSQNLYVIKSVLTAFEGYYSRDLQTDINSGQYVTTRVRSKQSPFANPYLARNNDFKSDTMRKRGSFLKIPWNRLFE